MTEQWRERIGDYRLTRELGRGAFGIIYEARQISLNREVALKVLPPSLFPDRDTVERFRTEAMAVARLRHPNIVTVHEAGRDGDLHYFSMDLMGGRSLADVIAERGGMPLPRDLEDSHFTSSMDAIMRRQGESPGDGQPAARPAPAPLSREECFTIVAKLVGVADALHYAHEKGVIHQDVKPSNLVFDDEGRLCLLDFGTAQIRRRPHEEDTASGALGTPLYASPEQLDAARGAIGPQTDVYSLGASMYEWTTLRPPFVAEDYRELRRRVLADSPVPAHEKNPAVPRELSAIIAKALARDLGARYASAKDLADDLRRFLRRQPSRAGAAGPWRRLALWGRRSPALASTIAAAVLLGIGALSGLAYILLSHETLIDRIREHFTLGAWTECMDIAEEMSFDSPDWPEAMLLKAECLNQLNRHDERLNLYQDLLSHEPGLFDRSELLMGKAKALADLRDPEAERCFRQAIGTARNTPSRAAAHYELGKFLDDLSSEEAALPEYAHAIELVPGLAKAQFAYGMLLAKRGDRAEAEPHLKQAVTQGGKDKPKYLAGLAEFYLAWGRPKDALEYADGAIAQALGTGRTRRTADYQVLKARILVAQQDYKGAIVLLQNAVDETDNRSEALYLLALAQLRTGKDDADAKTTADQFLKPEDAIYPAMLWVSLGNLDKALRYFQVLGPADFAHMRKASPMLWKDLQRLMTDLEAKDPAGYRKLAPAIEPYLR